MNKQEQAALKAELRQFTGSESVYRHSWRQYHYTEGVRHLARQAESYWLLDHIVFNQTLAILKEQPFQVWTITVNGDHTARISVEDDNGNELTFFHLGFTDFPLEEFSLWLVDQTILLPSEY